MRHFSRRLTTSNERLTDDMNPRRKVTMNKTPAALDRVTGESCQVVRLLVRQNLPRGPMAAGDAPSMSY